MQVDKLFCIITSFIKVVCSRSIVVFMKYPSSFKASYEIHITILSFFVLIGPNYFNVIQFLSKNAAKVVIAPMHYSIG